MTPKRSARSVCFILLCGLLGAAQAGWPNQPCRRPPLAGGYTLEGYSGRWFEIGKIQTAGGAFFEKK